MQIIESFSELPAGLPYPVMAIGFFDGVHRGHQSILRSLVARAAERQGTAIVLTFLPHPQKIITPAQAPLLLQTSRQKQKILEQCGVDLLVQLPFTRRLSLYSPEKFVREIIYRHDIREIYVGANFRFGHRRSGDFHTLELLGDEFGFQVYAAERVSFRGVRISSTKVRSLIAAGRVSLAKRLLGRPYQMQGTVVRGDGLGTKLGFPTANLLPENELIPGVGVYSTRAWVEGRPYTSVTNIGYRPTIDPQAEHSLSVETHLLDFQEDLHGASLVVDFCLRLRGEVKFPNLDALKNQIAKDIQVTRKYEIHSARSTEEAVWP